MSVLTQMDSPPLREDASGTVRVGESRVLLELIIREFQDGAQPEAIVQRYPTVTLADAYAVVAHYLRHPSEVEAYLARREQQAAEIRQKVEKSQRDISSIRTRIRSAREAQG